MNRSRATIAVNVTLIVIGLLLALVATSALQRYIGFSGSSQSRV